MNLVSVVIPTFNRSHLLKDAINSILEQSYDCWELIIIDDGSTDDTESVVQNLYKDFLGDKIIYIKQENQGEAVARNNGLELAKGDYIAFLDSDDFWAPTKLSEQVSLITNAKDNIVGVFSAVWEVNENGQKSRGKPLGVVSSINALKFDEFIKGVPIVAAASNLLLRMKAIKELGGFNKDFQYGEDQEFLLRLRENYEFLYIESPLVYYRVHENNQSRLIKRELVEKVFQDRISIILNYSKSKRLHDSELPHFIIDQLLGAQASWYIYYSERDLCIGCLKNIRDRNSKILLDEVGNKLAFKAAVRYTELYAKSPDGASDYLIELQLLKELAKDNDLDCFLKKFNRYFIYELNVLKRKGQVPLRVKLLIKLALKCSVLERLDIGKVILKQ